MMDFILAINRVLGIEGGYTNDPLDPGGETKWGISKRSYPDVDIANLTRSGAIDIYQRDFWHAGHMDEYDGALAYQVLDFAVNSGIQTALRKLQFAAGVADDGHVGPVTVAAIKAMPVPKILALFIAARGEYWAKLQKFRDFGAGWMNRMVADIRYAVVDWEAEGKPT